MPKNLIPIAAAVVLTAIAGALGLNVAPETIAGVAGVDAACIQTKE